MKVSRYIRSKKLLLIVVLILIVLTPLAYAEDEVDIKYLRELKAHLDFLSANAASIGDIDSARGTVMVDTRFTKDHLNTLKDDYGWNKEGFWTDHEHSERGIEIPRMDSVGVGGGVTDPVVSVREIDEYRSRIDRALVRECAGNPSCSQMESTVGKTLEKGYNNVAFLTDVAIGDGSAIITPIKAQGLYDDDRVSDKGKSILEVHEPKAGDWVKASALTGLEVFAPTIGELVGTSKFVTNLGKGGAYTVGTGVEASGRLLPRMGSATLRGGQRLLRVGGKVTSVGTKVAGKHIDTIASVIDKSGGSGFVNGYLVGQAARVSSGTDEFSALGSQLIPLGVEGNLIPTEQYDYASYASREAYLNQLADERFGPLDGDGPRYSMRERVQYIQKLKDAYETDMEIPPNQRYANSIEANIQSDIDRREQGLSSSSDGAILHASVLAELARSGIEPTPENYDDVESVVFQRKYEAGEISSSAKLQQTIESDIYNLKSEGKEPPTGAMLVYRDMIEQSTGQETTMGDAVRRADLLANDPVTYDNVYGSGATDADLELYKSNPVNYERAYGEAAAAEMKQRQEQQKIEQERIEIEAAANEWDTDTYDGYDAPDAGVSDYDAGTEYEGYDAGDYVDSDYTDDYSSDEYQYTDDWSGDFTPADGGSDYFSPSSSDQGFTPAEGSFSGGDWEQSYSSDYYTGFDANEQTTWYDDGYSITGCAVTNCGSNPPLSSGTPKATPPAAPEKPKYSASQCTTAGCNRMWSMPSAKKKDIDRQADGNYEVTYGEGGSAVTLKVDGKTGAVHDEYGRAYSKKEVRQLAKAAKNGEQTELARNQELDDIFGPEPETSVASAKGEIKKDKGSVSDDDLASFLDPDKVAKYSGAKGGTCTG